MAVPEPLTQSLADRYRFEREIGRGGMATVYLAHDVKHQRRVAIKVLHEGSRRSIGPRFLREIDVVARLTHPHVIPLFDSGDAGGFIYYVMPYIEGESLRARLSRTGRLSVDESVRLAREIAGALAHAHQHGVVHRDIKPENILLADGVALVADFGIARAFEATGEDAATELATQVGAVLGTPRYMSPEQAGGGAVDARSDLYALACVLYEMLAGEPPFVAPTASELMRLHLTAEARPLQDLRPSVPQSVAVAIARNLAKVPADRHATAAQFADALASVMPALAVPAPGAAATPTNLPKSRTRFIGREKELRDGARLLAETRMLTLTGIGGSGKTRLALQLAEAALGRYPDGVWFVDLAPLSDATQVAEAVAAQIGAREVPGKTIVELIEAALTNRRVLLVLDNCEHVISAVAELADALLSACGALTILATSREGLGVEGEQQMALRSLSTPSEATAVDLQAVTASDAVALFVDRARTAAPDFVLNDTNAAGVADICRRLDGIPLALELAAARVKMLSVDQIRAMLNDRFRLLVGGRRSAVPRHQTLQATIQWSYDQLSADEQRLFRTLSVFAGGWSLDLAARLAGHSGEAIDFLDVLGRLVDKSLVLVERAQRGEPRYRFLETVRQYAQERLVEAGESAAVHRRHVDLMIDLAERAYAERLEREGPWSELLALEYDNLRSAIEIASADHPERHLQLVGALGWFFMARSHFIEGREQLARALEATPPEPARRERARALWSMANLRSWQGDAAALPLMEDALRIWRALGDRREVAIGLEGLGWMHALANLYAAALSTFEECLGAVRTLGDPHHVNRVMLGVAQTLVCLHRVDEARPMATAIIEFSRAHDDKRSEHSGWHFLADCALIEGRCAESLRLYRRSLVQAQAIGDRMEISFEVQGIAMSLAELGEPSRALRLAGAMRAEWERLDITLQITFWDDLLDRYLGPARAALGPDQAARAWEAGRRLSLEAAIAEALAEQEAT